MVPMPPVPKGPAIFPAMASISLPMVVTSLISWASSWTRGSLLYRPPISVRLIIRSALSSMVIMAPRLSLSPNCRDFTATVSFSLIMGSTFHSRSVFSVFLAFRYRTRSHKSPLVRRIWATFRPQCSMAFSHSRIRSAWPMAQTAWRLGVSDGLFFRPIFLTPAAMAPEETRITSMPRSWSRQIWLAMLLMISMLRLFFRVSTPEPTLTTMRLHVIRAENCWSVFIVCSRF